MACVKFRVSGRVQGVFYRASTEETARVIGLTGWVRNLTNGDVEALACGSEYQLQQFRQWLKSGPPMALVDDVKETELNDQDYTDFNIRY